jgi:hypothetical protein
MLNCGASSLFDHSDNLSDFDQKIKALKKTDFLSEAKSRN